MQDRVSTGIFRGVRRQPVFKAVSIALTLTLTLVSILLNPSTNTLSGFYISHVCITRHMKLKTLSKHTLGIKF